MCGIAGFVQFEPHWQFSQLQKTADTLKHRGPDGFGFCHFSDPKGEIQFSANISQPHDFLKAGLMHRRLAIIEPNPDGIQPMLSENKKVALVFNGELYNYKILRKELAAEGIFTKTQTDTEVLLLAYQFWGKEVVKKMDGMFAFAILDVENQLFFAATDPTGIKPFYYSIQNGNLCFASEIKALLDFNIPKKTNSASASRFLAYGQSDETEETFFDGVFRLQGGFSIEINLHSGKVSKQPYHTFHSHSFFDFQTFKKEKDRVENIRALLIEMIGSRLQSDVPLGVCLSGGIDSSTIAGLMAFADKAKGNLEKRKAFMATLSHEDSRNEESFARLVAEKNQFGFYTTFPSARDFQTHFSDLIFTLDEPPPGLNAFSQYAVFRLVSENGIKVTLDGQGADEIFGGYPRQVEAWLWENLGRGIFPTHNFSWLFPAIVNKLKSLGGPEIQKKLLLKFKPENQIFQPNVWDSAGFPPCAENALNQQLMGDYTKGTLPFLLKAADRNSMRWSVESRMPFADFVPLVSYLFSIPGNGKIAPYETKNLLRKAAAPFLPEQVLNRKDKIGFAAPNREWLYKLLEQNPVKINSAYLDFEKFNQHANTWKIKPDSIDFQVLWRALAFQKWQEIFGMD